MKKKLIIIVMICIILFALVGCSINYAEAETEDCHDFGDGYFTTIKQWGENSSDYFIVYAKDTKVMYFVNDGHRKGGITPLYNADGTLQIYNE